VLFPRPKNQGNQRFSYWSEAFRFTSPTDFDVYRRGIQLPGEFFDSLLALAIRPLFLRGDYDTAVFRAFKEVETRVRTVSGLSAEQIGVRLMRLAFDPEDGRLTDMSQVLAEREAVGHFFAGAIGLFKNPSSHRNVSYGSEEAATLIRLADYMLLWIAAQDTLNQARSE
jgi:uncharacterized protein (TIGR02391 family)